MGTNLIRICCISVSELGTLLLINKVFSTQIDIYDTQKNDIISFACSNNIFVYNSSLKKYEI